ncbi:CCR4-NOT core subunit cdc39 [Conglomerata obtusa]
MNNPKSNKVDLITALANHEDRDTTKEQILLILEEQNIDLTDKSCADLICHMTSTYKSEYVGKQDDKIEKECVVKGKTMDLSSRHKEHINWKYKEIILAVKEYKASLNWIEIYKLMDNSTLKIKNLECFYLMIDLWSLINGNNTFPYGLFFGDWSNKQTQIDFITYLMESDPKKTNVFSNVFLTKIASLEDIKKGKVLYEEEKEEKNTNTKHPFTLQKRNFFKTHESNFNCVELFRCIANINSNLLIERASVLAPDWCLLGLSFIQPNFESLFENLLFDLFKSEKYSGIVKILYKQHPAALAEKMAKSLKFGISLSKILDIVLEAKMLPYILETLSPPYFSFEVLILSSKRDHLNIHLWMRNMYQTRKDQFINLFIWYLTEKFDSIDINEIYNKSISSDDQQEVFQRLIFPLSIDLTVSLIKTLEQLSISYTKDTITKFNKLKALLPIELKSLAHRRTKIESYSNEFITSITSGKKSIADGILTLQNQLKGDIYQRDLANNTFTYLVENYKNFHKLENYELMAVFYGRLIENKILPLTFQNKAINNILESLKYQKTGLQCNFALLCLENMYNYLKKEKKQILNEIETFEVVKSCLKDDEILFDEKQNNKGISLEELLSELFYIQNLQEESKNKQDNENKDIKMKELFDNVLLGSSVADEYNENFYNDIIRYYFANKIYEYKNYDTYVKFFCILGEDFFEQFLTKSLFLLKSMLNYNVDKYIEINLASAIGTLLGKMTIAKNRIFNIEIFDTYEYIQQCISKKKFTLCVYFTINFLRQGIHGLVFKPNNPWFMHILDQVSDLHHVNTNIYNEIAQIYKTYNIKFIPKQNVLENNLNKIMYLTNYSLESYESLLKHVISLALDFSIREVCTGFIDRTCDIAIDSGSKFILKIKINPLKEKKLFYNLILNLAKSLTHISAHEPVKTSIVSNVSFFVKNANLELETEEIYKIALENLSSCIKVIEGYAMSKIDTVFVKLYRDYISKKNESGQSSNENSIDYGSSTISDDSLDVFSNIFILTDKPMFEKIEIKPVLLTEINDLRNTLCNISKRIPNKKVSIINREWNNLLRVIDDERIYPEFNRVLSFIEESDCKDELCENLCQCIVGYILKDVSKRDLLLNMLNHIFILSFKTAKEVLSWMIYSEDDRKLNVDLVSGFVEHCLINLAEYDQHVGKCIKKDEKYFKFIMELLNRLILDDVKICTPYDFVYTIESLSRVNEEKYDDRIFDILKKVSDMMMPVEYFYESEVGYKLGSVDGIPIFEERMHKRMYLAVDFYKDKEKARNIDLIENTYKKGNTEIKIENDKNLYQRNTNSVFGPRDVNYNKDLVKDIKNANLNEKLNIRNNDKYGDKYSTQKILDKNQDSRTLIREIPQPLPSLEYPLSTRNLIFITLGGIHINWDIFIRDCKMPSLFSLSKIKKLIDFVATVDDFYLVLKIITPYYIESVHKKNYLFKKLYTYFLIELFKKVERTFCNMKKKECEYFIDLENEKEYQNCIYSFLKVISPMKMPIFVYSLLEIISLDYILDMVVQNEGFYIFRELLGLLNKNEKFLFTLTQFFIRVQEKHTQIFNKLANYFSLFTDNKYVFLKNFFNANKKINLEQKVEPMEFYSYRPTYLSIVNYLKGEISEKIIVKIKGLEENQRYWVLYALIDSLGTRNYVSENALKMLKMCDSEFDLIKRICLERNVANVPEMLKVAIEEMNLIDEK